ncbi:MAG: hypothetical protein Unbinned6437contig1000_72 [Prokaryotic dsDNA virus sp.]|nr:MAG: hypothetical protein Unbinned6437contig1000_72 [Prokaryotic dsDNA virus sp.]|tara:strand:- start:4328 stop:5074 length:747 start_codon:yes stop_codon:yes gene_type:complete
MNIEFKEGAVCFALGMQWHSGCKGKLLFSELDLKAVHAEVLIEKPDFQLNTIKQGDYIEASELDTEQNHNDAVDVFGLLGFECYGNYSLLRSYGNLYIHNEKEIHSCTNESEFTKRKLTYNQLMAIGELKRLEIERDNVDPTKVYKDWHESQKEAKDIGCNKSAPKTAPDLTPDLANKQEVKMQKNKPVVAQVMIDLTERMEIGIKTYGEALRANNGRDALQDAYEEALDLACYLKQAMIERDSKEVK